MLPTPNGTRFVNSYENRAIAYFASRLVKQLHCKAYADRSDVHYEGPELVGESMFHKLGHDQKIVALYLALKHLADRGDIYEAAEWKNAALECVYGWMAYEIAQEFMTANTNAKNLMVRAYQNQIDPNALIDFKSTDFTYWLNMIDKLAAITIWKQENFRVHWGEDKKDEELLVTDELLNSACTYFDEALASGALPV